MTSLKFCGIDFETQFKICLSMRKPSDSEVVIFKTGGVSLKPADGGIVKDSISGSDDEDAENSKDLEIGDNSPNKFTCGQ